MQLTDLFVPLVALVTVAAFVRRGERHPTPIWPAVVLCVATYPLGTLAADALGLDLNSSSGRAVRLTVALEAIFLAGPVATAARRAVRSPALKPRSRERV